MEIDGDSPVFTGLASGVSHGHPQVRWSRQLVAQDAGNASPLQEDCDGVGALPLKLVECAKFFGGGGPFPDMIAKGHRQAYEGIQIRLAR